MKLFTALAAAAVSFTGLAANAQIPSASLNVTYIGDRAYYCYLYRNGDAVCGDTTPAIYRRMKASYEQTKRIKTSTAFINLATDDIKQATTAIYAGDKETACRKAGSALYYGERSRQVGGNSAKADAAVLDALANVKQAMTVVCTRTINHAI